MNGKEVIERMAAKTGMTKADCEKAYHAFWESVREGLKEDGAVSLVGYGAFATRKLSAREGTNPRTGENFSVPARKGLTFKAGKNLKDAVRQE